MTGLLAGFAVVVFVVVFARMRHFEYEAKIREHDFENLEAYLERRRKTIEALEKDLDAATQKLYVTEQMLLDAHARMSKFYLVKKG